MAFDREALVNRYARFHLVTDPYTTLVAHLKHGAPEREIRLLEVNDVAPGREQRPLEPFNFCADPDGPDGHAVWMLPVTSRQWDLITRGELPLPDAWSAEGCDVFDAAAFQRSRRRA